MLIKLLKQNQNVSGWAGLLQGTCSESSEMSHCLRLWLCLLFIVLMHHHNLNHVMLCVHVFTSCSFVDLYLTTSCSFTADLPFVGLPCDKNMAQYLTSKLNQWLILMWLFVHIFAMVIVRIQCNHWYREKAKSIIIIIIPWKKNLSLQEETTAVQLWDKGQATPSAEASSQSVAKIYLCPDFSMYVHTNKL